MYPNGLQEHNVLSWIEKTDGTKMWKFYGKTFLISGKFVRNILLMILFNAHMRLM